MSGDARGVMTILREKLRRSDFAPVRRRLLLAGSVLPAACAWPGGGGAPLSAQPSDPGVVNPGVATLITGDRWRYRETNGYNGQPITEVQYELREVSPRLRLAVTADNGKLRADEIYASPWLVLQDPTYDYPQQFTDPLPVAPANLSPGYSELTSTTYRIVGADRLYPWQQRLQVDGWQRIKVPAGEFDCLRISRRVAFQHFDYLARLRAERWDTVWYAPRAKRWVRREWSGRYRMPGRQAFPSREDWVISELLVYLPSPISS